MSHTPVLLTEVLAALSPADGEVHLDGTYGGGGYARAILAAAKCQLLAVDRDLDAIARAEALAARQPRLIPLLGRFGDLDALAINAGHPALDGVVLDLGVSSFQLDEAHRGFSFQSDGPLDMRMGGSGPSAADAVNHLPEKAIADILFRLGEERASRRIARAIIQRRGRMPFSRTLDLADTVEQAVGGRKGARIHPATRTFQALRMYVNDELGELARALAAAENVLAPGGRLVVVSFHSLEDRVVKTFLRARAGQRGGPSRHMPGQTAARAPSFELIYRKAVEPSEAEAADNPRARSAHLRAARRTEAAAWGEVGAPIEGLFPLSELERLL